MRIDHSAHSALHSAICATALFVVGSAPLRAEPSPGTFLHPQYISHADTVYATILTPCGGPHPDPEHRPQVQRRIAANVLRYEIDLKLADEPEPCFSVGIGWPPRTSALDLGPVPEPYHRIEVVMRVWGVPGDDGTSELESESIDIRDVSNTPPVTASGLWWTPQVPGELSTITLASLPSSPQGSAFVTTQVFDDTGRLTPLTAVGQFDGPVFEAAALSAERTQPSDPEVEVQIVGLLRLEYLGCGRARLEIASDVPGIVSSERDIELVSRAAGISVCELPTAELLPYEILFDAPANP